MVRKNKVKFQLNFTNPYDVQLTLVGQILRIEILDKTVSDQVFVSAESGALHQDFYNLTKNIPRQAIDSEGV